MNDVGLSGEWVQHEKLPLKEMLTKSASYLEQTGDGAESRNISRHQKRVQAVAAAASIYQNSFVYPSPIAEYNKHVHGSNGSTITLAALGEMFEGARNIMNLLRD
ncbi:hypothetical protein L2E82_34804 [Cichorium intybus]|uniref:Uncharacterized protein n=1 Tax=Cichorium intybus TaxID=13427 RepID=A0ACB9BMQ9_CICIN|nr:hypothetical protein L2E82_34804 [Cichorium intybus]